MNCSSCGTRLPAEVAYCPNCGTVTSHKISELGIAPYDLTFASSPSGASLQAPPPTYYGSTSYGQNPYDPLNPYTVPLLAPPPPRPHHQAWRRPLIVLGSVSGVVLTAIGIIGFFVSFEDATSPLPSLSNMALTGFILSGIFICLGAFIFCKSAVVMIGRYIAGFSMLLAVILFISGFFQTNHAAAQSIFLGGVVIILLGGIFLWRTRTRKWRQNN